MKLGTADVHQISSSYFDFGLVWFILRAALPNDLH